uniref:Reverse transcriptase domain-containing protein n=1 Tax=Cajanus cajan TaxID=3821 RepID=A0A151TVE2_CAJCA|nr:hypothetical protein KK1_010260 [Cajanus cajan]
MRDLMNLFSQYGDNFGHCINLKKCHFFYHGALSLSRVVHVHDLLGFLVGHLPLVYLGVPLFKRESRA